MFKFVAAYSLKWCRNGELSKFELHSRGHCDLIWLQFATCWDFNQYLRENAATNLNICCTPFWEYVHLRKMNMPPLAILGVK